MKRRNFLYSSGILAAGLGTIPNLPSYSKSITDIKEDTFLNFDIASGAIPQKAVAYAIDRWSKIVLESSPYFTWDNYSEQVNKAREKTALLIGVSKEEIAICRNTTEGIDTILRGIDFRYGDEIIYSSYDYPFLINTILQLQKRYGVKGLDVGIDIFSDSDQEIIDKYEKLLTEQTRLLILTHVFNINGRELPVKEITEIANKKHTEVLIDGAQSFAHVPTDLNNLNAGFYTACYHKWFRGPLGTAFFYVKKEKISELWPLHGNNSKKSNNIRNFDHLSTLNFPAFLSICEGFRNNDNDIISKKLKKRKAINQKIIGLLRELQTNSIFLPDDINRVNGICPLIIKHFNPHKLKEKLESKYKIITKSMNLPNHKNLLRISVSEDITENDAEFLVAALKREMK